MRGLLYPSFCVGQFAKTVSAGLSVTFEYTRDPPPTQLAAIT